MKFLIVNTDYSDFLGWLYSKHPGLENRPYEDQMQVRIETLFGVADFLSSNLQKLGHEAWDVYANNEHMQRAWAEEHGVSLEPEITWRFRLRRGIIPWISRHKDCQTWFYAILAAQIKHYRPDVLLNWAMDGISTSFLLELKEYVRLLVGQGEPPVLLNERDWSVYDLVLPPSEGMVDYFREGGVKTEMLRFGFGSEVLSRFRPDLQRMVPITFVGSMGKSHSKRRQLLQRVCEHFEHDIDIWGPDGDNPNLAPPIRNCYRGCAWGKDFYQILFSSKITLNCHIDVAGEFADNMRLFEATGVGVLLLTDWKVNLHKMFEPGKEVIAYHTPEECAELIQYYLEHDEERKAIARAGQQRTLREHTYYHRMQELVDIVRRYL